MTETRVRRTEKRIKALLVFCTFLFSVLRFPFSLGLAYQPTPEEKQFLLEVERDSINFFTHCAHPETALVRDSSRPGSPSSIASTGFGLAAWAIAKERGWMSYDESYQLTVKCLKTLRDKVQHERGFFYHMVSVSSGRRVWSSEASSIDTALLIAGALFAGEVFKGTEVEKIAWEIYERVDWKWMMNRSDLLCHGWKPEGGFLPYYWDMYSEHLILQALAIGAPRYPVPSQSWNHWTRDEDEYKGKKVVYAHSGSLFTYQFSHAYIDFRDLWDQGINYFENSKNATSVNQEFCLDHAGEFSSYSRLNWGLSACLGPKGYKAYGSLPGKALHDGTIAVHAAAGSIPFNPEITINTLKHFYETDKEKLYSPYGFKDSFNREVNWRAHETLGIDQGITVLMIENFLDSTVWKKFMQIEPIKKWITLCQLEKASKTPPLVHEKTVSASTPQSSSPAVPARPLLAD